MLTENPRQLLTTWEFRVQIAKENTLSDNELVRNSVTILLYPSHVNTDMAAEAKKVFEDAMFVSPSYSVSTSLQTIKKLTTEDSGKYFDNEGKELQF